MNKRMPASYVGINLSVQSGSAKYLGTWTSEMSTFSMHLGAWRNVVFELMASAFARTNVIMR